MLAAVFPMLGFEPPKPHRLTPVWFPGWVIDAEVQGVANIRDREVCFCVASLRHLQSDFLPRIELMLKYLMRTSFQIQPPHILAKQEVKYCSYIPGKYNYICFGFSTLISFFQARTTKSSPPRPYSHQTHTPENQCLSPETSFANMISMSPVYPSTYLHSPFSTLLIVYPIGKLL